METVSSQMFQAALEKGLAGVVLFVLHLFVAIPTFRIRFGHRFWESPAHTFPHRGLGPPAGAQKDGDIGKPKPGSSREADAWTGPRAVLAGTSPRGVAHTHTHTRTHTTHRQREGTAGPAQHTLVGAAPHHLRAEKLRAYRTLNFHSAKSAETLL